MKLKNVLILLIISIILISIPVEIFAWTTKDATYEVCNIINVCISGTIKIVAWTIAIIYVVQATKYMKLSKEEPSKKIKNIQLSLIITIIQVVLLIFGASWVIKIGMETYTNGEIYQLFDVNTLIPNFIRIIAFVLIIFYIIKSIIYFISEEKSIKQKVINLIKWELITAIIVVILLILANYL